MGADGALNKAPLDPKLDPRPAHVSDDAVDASLARALDGATLAGRWDVVAHLAGELQARRLAREGIATLPAKKPQRGS